MRQFLLFTLMAIGLVGCQKDPPPAPKPAPVAAKKIDPAEAEKQKLQAVQKRVDGVYAALKQKHKDLAELSPQINEITLGDSNRLYEIISTQGIIYTNENVDYILLGSLLLGEEKQVQNFTQRPAAQEALAKLQASQKDVNGGDVFSAIWVQDGLSFKYGTGENPVIVFEDPDCPACQKLHKNFEEFATKLNMDVKVLPFVLTSKHPNGIMHAKTLLCAQDPATTWKNWMLAAEGKDVDAAWPIFVKKNNLSVTDCERAKIVDNWQTVGQQLGLSATPSIMFKSGMVGEGPMDEKSFIEAFEMVKEAVAARQVAPQAPTGVAPTGVAPTGVIPAPTATPSASSAPSFSTEEKADPMSALGGTAPSSK